MTSSESLRSQVEKQIVAIQKAQAQYKRQSPTWMCHSFIITELEQVLALIDGCAKELEAREQREIALHREHLEELSSHPKGTDERWQAFTLSRVNGAKANAYSFSRDLLVGNNPKELGEKAKV